MSRIIDYDDAVEIAKWAEYYDKKYAHLPLMEKIARLDEDEAEIRKLREKAQTRLRELEEAGV